MPEVIDNPIYLPDSVLFNIPSMVRNELMKLSAQKQSEFLEEYNRKAKSVGLGYLFLIVIFAMHYGYLNRWGLQILFWITGGGLFIWWFIDLFRIPGMVRDYNKDVAIEIMRNMKAIG